MCKAPRFLLSGPLRWIAARRVLPLAVLLGVTLPCAAQAQVVRGRLVEERADLLERPAEEESGIGGAMMTLIDTSGNDVEQVLTRTGTGLFELSPPDPGEYRLKAERIGYESTFSDYFRVEVGDTVTVRMTARVEAVSLVGIEADVGRRCEVRPEEGLAVAKVWNEARKALAAAAWTQERGLYQYEMLRIRRHLDRRGRRIEAEDRSIDSAYTDAPYVARPVDSLVAGGFARVTSSESVFWAPDAAVLLSDQFLDTHCLKVTDGGTDAPGMVGLSFEPVRERQLADIAGTMWLDPRTARLRWLDFSYVHLNVPGSLLAAAPGGRVEFETLPNGTWIVTSWSIRMFLPGEAIHPLTGRPAATLDGITVQSGDVLRVHGTEGVVYQGHTGGRIVGTVRDSLQVGLPGARVFLEGSGTEVVTDAQGRFELTHLRPGVYTVYYTHPYLEDLWYEPDGSEVEVENAWVPAELELSAPPLEEVLDDICNDGSRPRAPVVAVDKVAWRNGVLTGVVTDEAGQPLPEATVYLQAVAYEAGRTLVESSNRMGGNEGLENMRLRFNERTSDSGFYRACWVPVGIPLEVLVVEKDERIDRDALEEAPSLADLFPGRVQVITIALDNPYHSLDLRVGQAR